MGPDLRRGTPDPCEYESGAPEETCRVPRVGPRSPPPERGPGLSKVPGREGPRHGQGSGADTCPDFSLRSSLRRRPAAAAWLVTRDISQRAEPDARPIRLCSLCIYCEEDAPPATTLTGDAPSQHLMCPIQSAGRRRQGHPADGAPDHPVGKQCTHAERRTALIIPSIRSFPCTPRIRRSRASGRKKIAPAATFVAPSAIFFMSLGSHVGAQYLCACPPSAIKGEACDVTHRLNLSDPISDTHKFIQALSNTSHSGVGCYAPAARTTLNLGVFLCSSHFPTNKQNA
jgi:hypothetical protein